MNAESTWTVSGCDVTWNSQHAGIGHVLGHVPVPITQLLGWAHLLGSCKRYFHRRRSWGKGRTSGPPAPNIC